jgi:hypothetical protein
MATAATMTEFHLVPPETEATASGDGQAYEIGASGPRLFVLRLEITKTIEQQSLELSIWGSADGQNWGTMPLLKFPQRFYTGSTRMALDLTARPEVRFLRARWEVNRWGRVRPEPRFRFTVTARPAA